MRMMFVLVALLGFVAYPAIAAAPVEKGGKELATGQKLSQEKPVATLPQEGSMVLVPAGEFMMGSSTGDSDEQPAHKVYMDAFSMDKYEVTVGQYAAFLQAKGIDPPSDWNNHGVLAPIGSFEEGKSPSDQGLTGFRCAKTP